MDCSGNCQSFVSGDDFFVDSLLDLSNGFPDDGDGDENKGHKPCSLSPQKQPEDKEGDKEESVTHHSSFIPSVKQQDFGSELSLPGSDLENLEWLSHFVEDSFSEYSLTYSSGNLPEKALDQSFFTAPTQAKAKTGTRIWPLEPPSLSLTKTSTPSSSSSSSTTTISSSPTKFWGQLSESVGNKTPARKPKKKMEKRAGIGPKQCSHCGVLKTPLWRTGPLGDKTLCNACGVRFKSGRLLPEYRPASSPTFSTGLHSNSHRKVLEMRQKKEIEGGCLDAPTVQSF
ncbi:hypothetical protein HAX54_030767 [Datura stramonium]|uniref:GATA transcription factor n=1 Tax=Datura stramonium TaxID=4076 RepID=A0ABS8V841_DATST|nr:hypothetical protein [Datura stramonium]